jgi:asparagine synthase (glutamine-hydrolysing)
MCGFLLTNLRVDPGKFARAMAAMKFRGPDNLAIVPDFGGYTVGHCRLAIIGDPVLANQPMVDATGRYLLVFNGEIYNFRELAVKHGLALDAASDTELLLKMYIQMGPRCVEELNGMFSFAVVDSLNGGVFAARDRLGTKPLFIWRKGDSFALCSEVASMLELVGGLPPDPFAIRQYRVMRGVFNGRTFYHGVASLPAGATWDGQRVSRYWTLEQKFDELPSRDELRELLDSSIEYRMVADVEVGGFLSGGLDSTIVTLESGIESTWCVGFDGDEDFAFAREVAEAKELCHHEVVVDDGEFLHAMRRMVAARMEPLCVPNEVLVFLAARDAREQGIKCTLSGEGADELFAGYDRIFRWASAASEFDIRAFAQQYCYGTTDDIEVVEDAVSPYLQYGTPYLIVSAFFQTAHLGGLLRRLDFATMFASVEGREPFVDYRLVERLFGLPTTYKHRGGIVKAPLKEAYQDLVPIQVLRRPKVGFPVPLERIFGETGTKAAGYTAWFNENLRILGWLQ